MHLLRSILLLAYNSDRTGGTAAVPSSGSSVWGAGLGGSASPPPLSLGAVDASWPLLGVEWRGRLRNSAHEASRISWRGSYVI